MRLVTYQYKQRVAAGLVLDDRVLDLALAYRRFGLPAAEYGNGGIYRELNAILRHSELAFPAIRKIAHLAQTQKIDGRLFLPLSQVCLLAPVLHPGKIICVGLNYLPLTGGTPPPYPVLFHKAATALTGHGAPILLPAISRQVEYEGELALVIGRRARQVSSAQAWDYLAGFTIANDVGAADVQARTSQWTSGKMFDTFCPLGPYLVTVDEVPQPERLQIRTYLNDRLVQDAPVAEMVYSIPELVSYISQLTTLEPGDLILTGSPPPGGRSARPAPVFAAGRSGAGVD